MRGCEPVGRRSGRATLIGGGISILRLTFSSLGRCQMAEYSKLFGNVGERACACRGARIPEEGAQRPTSLDWVLAAVQIANCFKARRRPEVRRG